jgi:hypothetical protein
LQLSSSQLKKQYWKREIHKVVVQEKQIGTAAHYGVVNHALRHYATQIIWFAPDLFCLAPQTFWFVPETISLPPETFLLAPATI